MGGENQPAAHLGSFRVQQIGGDYLSLIRCKVDSRFIDSCTACRSFGTPVKNQTRGRGHVDSTAAVATNEEIQ